MCGRYLFRQELNQELEAWLETLDEETRNDLSLHDVYPSQKTLVLAEDLKPKIMRWGFQKWDEKGLVINARSETVDQSSFFKDHLKARRCLIEVEGFYEWDQEKQKYLVKPRNEKHFYMAGIYTDEPEPRFCILTTPSQGEFKELHSRFPLMIPERYKSRYLTQGDALLNDFRNLEILPITWENQSPQTRLF